MSSTSFHSHNLNRETVKKLVDKFIEGSVRGHIGSFGWIETIKESGDSIEYKINTLDGPARVKFSIEGDGRLAVDYSKLNSDLHSAIWDVLNKVYDIGSEVGKGNLKPLSRAVGRGYVEEQLDRLKEQADYIKDTRKEALDNIKKLRRSMGWF